MSNQFVRVSKNTTYQTGYRSLDHANAQIAKRLEYAYRMLAEREAAVALERLKQLEQGAR